MTSQVHVHVNLTISLPSTWWCWMWCFGCRFHVAWPRTASRWTRSWRLLCGVLWMCCWLWDSQDWGMQTGWWWRWSMHSTMTAGLCSCRCLVWRGGHWGQTGWYFMRRCWCFTMARWWLLGKRESFSSGGDMYATKKNIKLIASRWAWRTCLRGRCRSSYANIVFLPVSKNHHVPSNWLINKKEEELHFSFISASFQYVVCTMLISFPEPTCL